MIFNCVAIALALATLARGSLNNASNELCLVYTIVESPIFISTCFSSTTVLQILSVTPISITYVPTCLSSTLIASSTLSIQTIAESGSGSPHSPLSLLQSNSTSTLSSSSVSVTSPTSPKSSSYTTKNVPTSTTSAGLSASTDGVCGAESQQTCAYVGSEGVCCSEYNNCGHSAQYCGTGCQAGYGNCYNISNDGTCGYGVSCQGSRFGDCCSEYFSCGPSTDADFCGAGCQPEFGLCYGVGLTASGYTATAATVSASVSAS